VSRLIRPAVVVALVGVFAAVLVACGGSSDDPNKLLKETFTGNHKVNSGKLNVSVDVSAQNVPNLSQPVKIALTGPFQSQGKGNLPKFDLNVTFSGGGQSFSAGAVSTSDKGYLRFQGQAYEVPANTFNQFKQGFTQAQQRNQGNQNQSAFKRLGLNPLDWLKDPKVEGDQDVGGTSTKHITADVDVPKFVGDLQVLLRNAKSLGAGNTGQLPSSLTAAQQQQIQQAVKSAKVQVWTGSDDKILRKLQVTLGINGSGGRSGSLTFTLEIDDLNQSQTINAPANAKPFTALTQQLQGLGLGGALGGAGAGTTGAGSTGAGTTGGTTSTPSTGGSSAGGSSAAQAKLQKYAQCLQAANGDAAKAQQCAQLLK
jgi:hypothetical protein